MGFELDRLMKQRGVSTPGMINYSGTAAPVMPKEPVAPPVGSDAATSGLYPGAQTKYQSDLAAYNTQKTAYEADKALFDKYKVDYQNRVQNTPQYLDAQYRTDKSTAVPAPTTVQGLYQTYLSRNPEDAGADNWTRQFADPQAYLAANPDVAADSYFGKNPLAHYDQFGRAEGRQLTPVIGQQQRQQFFQAARPEMQSSGLSMSGRDIYDTTGSYHGDLLSSPVYQNYQAPVVAGLPTISGVNSMVGSNLNLNNDSSGGGGGDSGSSSSASSDASGEGGGMSNSGEGGADAGWARGGQVKTHYQTAGPVKLPSGYGSAEEEQDFAQRFFTPSPVEINPVSMDSPPPAMMTEAPTEVAAPLTQVAINTARATSEPVPEVVAPPKPPAPIPFGGERLAGIQALLASYGPKDSAYGEDLKTARASAKAETDAFAKMLAGAMKSPEDEKSSKAEMYFRLAAAFGAPTKTGQFSENLGMVGKELGEYSKDKRASAQQKLALAIKAQEMKMTGAKEDLKTLQSLAGEEMKDKRAIATELIKDYIKSGEPQSAAGKQALDEGLKPGTPDYQKRVGDIGNMNVEAKLAQINASLANVSTAQANLALSQQKFDNQKSEQAKLTPQELKLKVDTEDTLAQTDAALGTLKKAYALNPNTFDTSLSDMAQRKALEITDSKNPKVVATREQENLLEKAALAQLKSTFPGAISNDERKALQDVQGLGAKSRDERAKIMKNAYTALQSIRARHAKRLVDINQGVYRSTTSTIDGGND